MKQITFRLICFVLLVAELPVFNIARIKPEHISQLPEQDKPIERSPN